MSITKTEQNTSKNQAKGASEINLSLCSFTHSEADLMRLLESFIQLHRDLEFLELRFRELQQQIKGYILR